MALNDRSFQEVDIRVCSATAGEVRFPLSREAEASPESTRSHTPLLYRNNLTAFSQFSNLYFIAYGATVHVHVPSFPLQALPTIPELVIRLDESEPGRPGYINTLNPHGVNHLIVGELGSEEVLFCACDDGDVIGYTLRSIVRRIEEIKFEKKTPIKTSSPKQLVPFLLHNVKASAWGLAIHKAARMVAVSANTHVITVFAFALDKPKPNNEEESEPDRTQRNLTIELLGHSDNIPTISFCNLPCDTTGKYLLSADIRGKVILWDVWNEKMLEVDRSKKPPDHSLTMAGWVVMFIDTRWFRHADTEFQLYGCKPTKTHGNGLCLSMETSHVKDASRYHRSMPSRESVWLPPDTPLDDDDVWALLIALVRRRGRQGQQVAGASRHNYHASPEFETGDEVEQRIRLTISDGEDREDDVDDDNDEDDDEDEGRNNSDDDSDGVEFSNNDSANGALLLAGNNGLLGELYQEAVEDDQIRPVTNANGGEEDEDLRTSEIEEDSPAEAEIAVVTEAPNFVPSTHDKVSANFTRQHQESTSKPDRYPFSILHTTKHDIYLRQRSLTTSRITRFSYPLAQHLPSRLSGFLEPLDRLNLSAHIPELGLVILGSQVGRVAVLTLTRDGRHGHHGTCGMRLDWILPFQSQEVEGVRPDEPLIGLAVGPVQGYQGSASCAPGSREASSMGRRFRIMLTYSDNTVLAYEVWRGPETGEGARMREETMVL